MFDPELVDALLQKKLTRNTKIKSQRELIFADCPKCGEGTDRFHVNSYKGGFWCRSCSHQGSIPDLVKELFNVDYDEAFSMLGDSTKQSQNIYVYTDENGKPIFEARRGMKGGAKTFIQCLPGGKKGTVKNERRVLYNLPAVQRQNKIYIVEGEKDVETMRLLNFTATCNVGGAKKFHLVDSQSLAHLKDKDIFVIPDNDQAGKEHAQQVCEILYRIAKSVTVIDLPDLPEKGDVTDFLATNGAEKTKEIVSMLSKELVAWEPPRNFEYLTEYMDQPDFTGTKEDIIIPQGVLLQGEALLIAAEYAQMKSMIRIQLSLCLAAGIPWLCEQFTLKPRKVGIFQWENSPGMEIKRMNRMLKGLGVERRDIGSQILFHDREERFDLTNKGDQSRFLERCLRMEAEVLMFDNLSNMHIANENDNVQMRAILDFLRDVALKTNTSIVLVHHMGKPGQNPQQLKYRIRGASSIQDWASTIMTIAPADDFGNRIVKELGFPKLRDPDGDFLNNDLFVEFLIDQHMFVRVEADHLYKKYMDEVAECIEGEGKVVGYDNFKKLVREVCEVNQNKAVEIIKAMFKSELIVFGQKEGRSKTYVLK